MKTKPKTRLRFDVGASVRVKRPGINGVVTALDVSPTSLGEYWHTILTEHGERKGPGCNIELIPVPLTNMKKGPAAYAANQLLPPDQAIPMLRKQLDEAVESLRYNDPDVDAWERISLRIVERTFGEHTRNANHFVCSLSYPHSSEEEAQRAHEEHIAEKKGLLRAFIRELEIIPPQRPAVDVTKQGVFWAGQTFDALSVAARIMETAKTRLLLIDRYIGSDTLNLLPTTGIALDVLTKPPLAPVIKTLCVAFKAQHGMLSVRTTSAFHDRFLVIDNSIVYHFGASIKDLGKKTFMFSLIEEPEVVTTIQAKVNSEWARSAVEI